MTCITDPCDPSSCVLTGGCVKARFAQPVPRVASELKRGAPALNGVKPARTNRDPARIKRTRKDPRW